ncbi:MAG: hypothetical protein U0Q12_13375 [Vicinamibacterales bacterium]
MISTRYGPATALLLALALVPTLLAVARGDRDDGLRVESVPAALIGLASTPTDRQAAWAERHFGSTAWLERQYGSTTRLSIVRSHDFKRLYHHPELALAYQGGLEYDRAVVVDGIPVVVLRSPESPSHVGAYVLLYGRDEVVEHPYLFHLGLVTRLLVSQRQPMTLFFVYDEGASPAVPLDQALAVRLVLAAAQAFRVQAPGAPSGSASSGPEAADSRMSGGVRRGL